MWVARRLLGTAERSTNAKCAMTHKPELRAKKMLSGAHFVFFGLTEPARQCAGHTTREAVHRTSGSSPVARKRTASASKHAYKRRQAATRCGTPSTRRASDGSPGPQRRPALHVPHLQDARLPDARGAGRPRGRVYSRGNPSTRAGKRARASRSSASNQQNNTTANWARWANRATGAGPSHWTAAAANSPSKGAIYN